MPRRAAPSRSAPLPTPGLFEEVMEPPSDPAMSFPRAPALHRSAPEVARMPDRPRHAPPNRRVSDPFDAADALPPPVDATADEPPSRARRQWPAPNDPVPEPMSLARLAYTAKPRRTTRPIPDRRLDAAAAAVATPVSSVTFRSPPQSLHHPAQESVSIAPRAYTTHRVDKLPAEKYVPTRDSEPISSSSSITASYASTSTPSFRTPRDLPPLLEPLSSSSSVRSFASRKSAAELPAYSNPPATPPAPPVPFAPNDLVQTEKRARTNSPFDEPTTLRSNSRSLVDHLPHQVSANAAQIADLPPFANTASTAPLSSSRAAVNAVERPQSSTASHSSASQPETDFVLSQDSDDDSDNFSDELIPGSPDSFSPNPNVERAYSSLSPPREQRTVASGGTSPVIVSEPNQPTVLERVAFYEEDGAQEQSKELFLDLTLDDTALAAMDERMTPPGSIEVCDVDVDNSHQTLNDAAITKPSNSSQVVQLELPQLSSHSDTSSDGFDSNHAASMQSPLEPMAPHPQRDSVESGRSRTGTQGAGFTLPELPIPEYPDLLDEYEAYASQYTTPSAVSQGLSDGLYASTFDFVADPTHGASTAHHNDEQSFVGHAARTDHASAAAHSPRFEQTSPQPVEDAPCQYPAQSSTNTMGGAQLVHDAFTSRVTSDGLGHHPPQERATLRVDIAKGETLSDKLRTSIPQSPIVEDDDSDNIQPWFVDRGSSPRSAKTAPYTTTRQMQEGSTRSATVGKRRQLRKSGSTCSLPEDKSLHAANHAVAASSTRRVASPSRRRMLFSSSAERLTGSPRFRGASSLLGKNEPNKHREETNAHAMDNERLADRVRGTAHSPLSLDGSRGKTLFSERGLGRDSKPSISTDGSGLRAAHHGTLRDRERTPRSMTDNLQQLNGAVDDGKVLRSFSDAGYSGSLMGSALDRAQLLVEQARRQRRRRTKGIVTRRAMDIMQLLSENSRDALGTEDALRQLGEFAFSNRDEMAILERQEALDDTGALAMLVRVQWIHLRVEYVQILCSSVLASLRLGHGGFHGQFSLADAVGHLIDSVGYHVDKVDVIVAGIRALSGFVLLDEVRECCEGLGERFDAMGTVLHCMELHEDCAELVTEAATFLANACFKHDETKMEVLSRGGLRAILAAMGRFPNNNDLQLACTLTVRNVAAGRADLAQAVVRGGGVRLLLCTLRAHDDDAQLVQQCMAALKNVVVDGREDTESAGRSDAARQVMSVESWAKTLVQCIDRYGKLNMIVQNGLAVLCTVAEQGRVACQVLIRENGVEMAMNCMHRNVTQQNIMSYGARLGRLLLLSGPDRDAQGMQRVDNGGGIDRLIDLLYCSVSMKKSRASISLVQQQQRVG